MMSAGSAAASESAKPVEAITPADKVEAAIALERSDHAGTMPDTAPASVEHRVRVSPVVHHRAPAKLTELDGCVTMDGLEVRLATLQSGKIYRLQGMTPFAENMDRILHVTGYPGSVAPVADPSIPTFTVDTADELAPNCHAKISREKLLAVRSEKRHCAGWCSCCWDGRHVLHPAHPHHQGRPERGLEEHFFDDPQRRG